VFWLAVEKRRDLVNGEASRYDQQVALRVFDQDWARLSTEQTKFLNELTKGYVSHERAQLQAYSEAVTQNLSQLEDSERGARAEDFRATLAEELDRDRALQEETRELLTEAIVKIRQARVHLGDESTVVLINQ
jgi:uncharacterized protein Smg (DUF494 family)